MSLGVKALRQWCAHVTSDALCLPRLTFQKAFVGVVKETDDLAGQHELISENMMVTVYKEFQVLHNELKTERRKVTRSS